MDPDELAFAGLARHADMIAAGELSARKLTELFLARLRRLDPLLNAFRVAIKDDLDVAGEITVYGCDAGRRPAAVDAEVVGRVRDALEQARGRPAHRPAVAA